MTIRAPARGRRTRRRPRQPLPGRDRRRASRTSRARSTPPCPTAAATSSACSTPRTRSRPTCCGTSTTRSGRHGRRHRAGRRQLMNVHSSWFASRNCLEYYFWFRSRLHLHAAQGLHPARRQHGLRPAPAARARGRLGRRLPRRGLRPRSAPVRAGRGRGRRLRPRARDPRGDAGHVGGLVRQRTRWNQGFLQVLRKGDWKSLPPQARLLAAYTLAFPFVQAVMRRAACRSAIIVSLVAQAADRARAALVRTADPAARMIVVARDRRAASNSAGIRASASALRDIVLLVIGAVPYQLVLSLRPSGPCWRESRGVTNWEKTEHVGAHL